MPRLRILVVATKTPWPSVDGGRLVLLTTLEALAADGHELELVAPCTGDPVPATVALSEVCTPHLVAARPRPALVATLAGLVRGVPTTVARHSLPAVRRAVEAVLGARRFDVIHAEQLHALAQLEGSAARGLPVVHRAHNVESLLWAHAASHRPPPLRPLTAFEARRMSACEARALDATTCTIALTEPDRRRLAELAPGATIHTVAAPFAAELPPGDTGLEGEPAVVTIASVVWGPSRDAAARLVGEIWPAVRRRLPGAVLHLFGGPTGLTGDGVVHHPPPTDSRTAFPEGAIALVPERHPTGVPMKALEAWARGLPLVVDPETADALAAADGVELVVARGAAGYAEALARLAGDTELRCLVVAGGRRALAERHDPARVAERLGRIYRWAAESASSP
jgi:hypothetical protein